MRSFFLQKSYFYANLCATCLFVVAAPFSTHFVLLGSWGSWMDTVQLVSSGVSRFKCCRSFSKDVIFTLIHVLLASLSWPHLFLNSGLIRKRRFQGWARKCLILNSGLIRKLRFQGWARKCLILNSGLMRKLRFQRWARKCLILNSSLTRKLRFQG